MLTNRQKMGDNSNDIGGGGSRNSPTVSTMVMDLGPSVDNFNSFDRISHDVPDILVPTLTPSTINPIRGQHQEQNRRNGSSQSSDRECASDSKKFWQRGILSPRKRACEMEEIQAGPTASCFANDERYNTRHPQRGRCLIFNHIRFDKTQGLSERVGSEVDVKSIQSTFAHLGFHLTTYDDLKFEQIMLELRKVSEEDHSQNDCLAVFVLTHGVSNELHAFDIVYKPSSLWNIFTADNCTTLAGKPKMFFINACRGDRYDDGTFLKQGQVPRTQVDGPSSNEHSYRIPNQADFLTVFSTYEATTENIDMLTITMKYLSLGFYSWRNNRNGSCFIQALCKILNEYAGNRDVLSMLTLVNRQVALNYESRSKDNSQNMKKQIPHVCHTLMRDVFLIPPYRSTLV